MRRITAWYSRRRTPRLLLQSNDKSLDWFPFGGE
jgi:hypothetical protein